MKLKFVARIIPLLILSIACSCFWDGRNGALVKQGNEVVHKVESFKKTNGRLPNSLSEIGIEEKEEGPIYYDKKSDTRYIVWFGTILGESITYDSDTQKWE